MARLTKTRVNLRNGWAPIAQWELSGLSESVRQRVRLRQLTPDNNPSLTEIDVKDTWVESPLNDEWLVAYRILAERGAPVVGEIRIFPNEPDRRVAGRWSAEYLGGRAVAPAGGVTRQVLDRVRLSEPLTQAGEILEKLRSNASDFMLEERGLSMTARPRRGRKGHGDLFYAQVARDYVAAVEAGSPSPATDVARRRRLGSSGPARVRDLLHEARRRALLTPAPVRGRRGGDLTAAARALLAGASTDVPGHVPVPSASRPASRRARGGARSGR